MWLYPSRDAKKAVSTKTITKQLGDRQRDDDPMKRRSKSVASLKLQDGKWGPHDLRRTGATMMTRLGVLPEVAERCLNHVEQNRMKRIYQRHTYEAEMQSAWRLLGQRLAILTKDDNEDSEVGVGTDLDNSVPTTGSGGGRAPRTHSGKSDGRTAPGTRTIGTSSETRAGAAKRVRRESPRVA